MIGCRTCDTSARKQGTRIARSLRLWRKAAGAGEESEEDEKKKEGEAEPQAEGESAEAGAAEGVAEAEGSPPIAAKLEVVARKVFRTPDPGGGGDDDKWRRAPRNLQEQMVMNEAQAGAGEMIIASLNDPRFKGMQKWHYSKRVAGGQTVVVHYVKDPKTGELKDFKFKD